MTTGLRSAVFFVELIGEDAERIVFLFCGEEIVDLRVGFFQLVSGIQERGIGDGNTGDRIFGLAGNHYLTLSVLVPEGWRYEQFGTHELFAQPVLTRTGTQRVVIGCDVVALSGVIEHMHGEGIQLEHVYDY